jgi:Family of unknown function (DUF6526)
MQRPQTYANHVNRPRLTAGAAVFAIVALGFLIAEAFRRPGLLVFGVLCLTLAVMFLIAISRVYIVRLQDRIILLEMRVRLARLGREADYTRLSKRQLVALRFASDAELPALIQRAVSDNLTSRQIKEAIRDWQPDYQRT